MFKSRIKFDRKEFEVEKSATLMRHRKVVLSAYCKCPRCNYVGAHALLIDEAYQIIGDDDIYNKCVCNNCSTAFLHGRKSNVPKRITAGMSLTKVTFPV